MKVRITDRFEAILGRYEEEGRFTKTFEIVTIKDVFEVEEYIDSEVGECLSFIDSYGMRHNLHPDSVVIIED